MKRRTVLHLAAVAAAVPFVGIDMAKAGTDETVISFHDENGREIARIDGRGKVTRQPGSKVLIECGRMFWSIVTLTHKIAEPKSLDVEIAGDGWTVILPADGSLLGVRFTGVDDNSSRFFWRAIQHKRPEALKSRAAPRDNPARRAVT